MEKIKLRKATIEDKSIVVDFDYQLNKIERLELRREEKITKAISNDECFLILADKKEAGFVIFDYRFFDQGWIELPGDYRLIDTTISLRSYRSTPDHLYPLAQLRQLRFQSFILCAQFLYRFHKRHDKVRIA